MTGQVIQLTMLGMASPGRRPSTSSEYRELLQQRTKKAREDLGYSLERMAESLTIAMGRPVRADTYRKWESESLIPHDAIIPFCEITGTEPFWLLTGVPFSLAQRTGNVRPKHLRMV